jgi:2-dehydro-3-deoxyphosphogluconate aldolase / (4S)-4-hydroxy-2-oxoglutarate aldolase
MLAAQNQVAAPCLAPPLTSDPTPPMTSPASLPSFKTRVVPVVALSHADQAVPLARALLAGGIDVIEITLRHPCALDAIAAVATAVPDMVVGAGTLLQAADVDKVVRAGARFALSPGHTSELLDAVLAAQLPFVPGVMTPSEVMQVRSRGFRVAKLFPAAQAGGQSMLRALAGPIPDMRFCPTGGVTEDNFMALLAERNVAMVGGSWLAPLADIEAGRWAHITTTAQRATDLLNRL